MAGLPVIPGVAVYYAGVDSGLLVATTVATASVVYAMLHVDLSALGKLGGIKSVRFWAAIVTGVTITFATESSRILRDQSFFVAIWGIRVLLISDF